VGGFPSVRRQLIVKDGAAVFDELTEVYEAMIDWPKRLANEEPFYRRVFDRVGARSVVDVACGTGRHAAMFHAWGLRVEGADLSPQMIQRARERYGDPAGLRWVIRGFDEPVAPTELFDVAICVGNSLALAPNLRVLERALLQMLSAVRRGGALVVHVLNLWRLAEGPCVWQKCTRIALVRGEALILKGVHRCGSRGYVELLVADPAGGQWHSDSVRFLGVETLELEDILRGAGAQQVLFYGGYQEQPYERNKSVDLILVAEK
jgi:SAM-dependent methyltransferase